MEISTSAAKNNICLTRLLMLPNVLAFISHRCGYLKRWKTNNRWTSVYSGACHYKSECFPYEYTIDFLSLMCGNYHKDFLNRRNYYFSDLLDIHEEISYAYKYTLDVLSKPLFFMTPFIPWYTHLDTDGT